MKWLPAGIALLLTGVCLAAEAAPQALCARSTGIVPSCQVPAKEVTGASRHDVHYRGDSRGLLTAIAATYGLSVIFDDNFPNRHVRFDLDNADFATTMHAASAVTKTFSVAIEDKVLLALVNNPENHRLYDGVGMRSFSLPGSSTQELQDLMNMLRALFEFKFVSLDAPTGTITVRGPKTLLDLASQLIAQLATPLPEVMVDLQVFQLSHTYVRQLGLHVPDSFNLYSLASALSGINSGDSVATILTKLESEDSSILSNPVTTFGGGVSFFGLSLDRLSAELSKNDSFIRSLDHVQLHASQQRDATFRMGLRYPIQTSIYSSITSSVSTSTLQSLGLSSSQISALTSTASSTIPSVSYEDIGLMLKVRPRVYNNSDVALELEMQFRTLGTINTSGMPNIMNREFKSAILLKEGEPAVVAGMISESDQRSLSGLPTVSSIAGFGLLTSQHSKQEEDDELLILITPYLLDRPKRAAESEIWMLN